MLQRLPDIPGRGVSIMSRRLFRWVLGTCVFAITFLTLGCTGSHPPKVGLGDQGLSVKTLGIGPTTSPKATVASSRVWAHEGARLRQFKRQMNSKYPNGKGGPGFLPGNAGDWAFESMPIDVSSPGVYVLRFGPLPNTFHYPRSPSAFALSTPWDERFAITVSGAARTVAVDGLLYFEVPVSVSQFVAPYPDLTAWIY